MYLIITTIHDGSLHPSLVHALYMSLVLQFMPTCLYYWCFLQGWVLLSSGGIKHSSLCLTLESHGIVLLSCNKGDAAQRFDLLPNGLLYHRSAQLCLTSHTSSSSSLATMGACSASDPSPPLTMTWRFRTASSS